jgi:DUF4097 and DUF4098 domain-containing protein YvlB
MIATLLSLVLLAYGDVIVQQHVTVTPPASPTVRIETTNGSIGLRTGGSVVDVTATKKADSQLKVDALKVTQSVSGSLVTIKAVLPQACSDCGSVSFDVTIPAGAKVQLIATNGSITADGLSAAAVLQSTNGSLKAAFSKTPASGSIAMQSTNGSVSLVLPSVSNVGRVSAKTMVGKISSNVNLSINGSNFVGSSVDQTLNPGGIALDLSTTNGSISIRKN